ncbi:MAG: xylulokinase [Fusobacteriaceae bacterium]
MYIGIDLGTSAVKLLLMDKDGKVIRTVSKEYPLIFPKEGWIEQNPDEWIEKSLEGLKEIVKDYEDKIKAISFSGQMHGSVFLDENDKVIRPALLWCDQRTSQQCEKINGHFGKDIIKLTGNIALTGFTAPKILWLKDEERENFNKIKKIMLPKDYLAFKLSGSYSTDVSDASGMLLLDVENRCWSKEVLDYLNITEEQLPKLYESYECVGTLKEDIRALLGISNTVKIVAGGGDQAVGAVGTGVVEDGILSVALGTSGVVFANSSKYSADSEARLHSFCHANGGYHQMGVMLSAGASLKWWIENINSTKDYQKYVEEEAQNADIENKVYFLPYLTGERTPHNNPHVRGEFIGLSIQNTRGDMTRGVIEGISFALRDSLELIREQGIEIKKIRVSGGGARSPFWKQLLADVFNSQVEIINSVEGPAYGAAILAAVGDGAYKDVNSACKEMIKALECYQPNEKNIEIYNKKYNKFKSLYPIVKAIYEEGGN